MTNAVKQYLDRWLTTVFSFFSVMDREGRGIEYHMVKVIFFYALVLLIPGDTLNWAYYAELFKFGVGETGLAVCLVVLAVIRGMSLYINGFHYRTPQLRALTSLISCLFFGMLSYNVWMEYFIGGLVRPSPTMAFYPAFVLAEFRAASRLRWEKVYASTF